jgi:hypothetical protein
VSVDTDTLSIRYYERRSRRLFGDELPPQEVLRDLDLHMRVVIEATQTAQSESITITQKLRSADAKDYFLYGVGRRLGMIAHSLRCLFRIASPDREEPIDLEEGRALTRDLNVVYINIVGAIDNLAWAAFLEKAPDAAMELAATQIGLFTRSLTRIPELMPLARIVKPHRLWFDELRAKRDPAAHRIPLYLPPSLLNEGQVAEHRELEERASEAIRSHDWDGWSDILNQQRKLGRFYPVFLHSPSEPLYRFYPTVPEDAGQMVTLIKAVTEFLSG